MIDRNILAREAIWARWENKPEYLKNIITQLEYELTRFGENMWKDNAQNCLRCARLSVEHGLLEKAAEEITLAEIKLLDELYSSGSFLE